MDIKVFPNDHPHHEYIVYDPDQREYYNTKHDIFLCEDDIKFYNLRPYTSIQCPLPKPLPPNYFYSKEQSCRYEQSNSYPQNPLHSMPTTKNSNER